MRPAGAQSPVAVDAETFVDAAYRDLLGRPPEAQGRRYWVGLLEGGEPPRAVLAWIGNSPEHRRHMVTLSYQQILRRAPDPGGLDYWARALGDTLALAELQASLLASGEYFLRFGSAAPPRASFRLSEASPARGVEVDAVTTVRVGLDTNLMTTASTIRVSVAGRPLPGQVSAGSSPDTLVYQAGRLPTWVQADTPAPVIVTVLGYDGETVSRADYRFTLQVRRQVVASFTTPLQPGARRNNNIHLAADYIEGDVIPAGSTYSLNQGIGQRTAARGFGPNVFIDEGGDVISVIGGGVSQMGTTFLNASRFAGLRLDDFRQHTIYFERYPMCREATLAWGSLDLVVSNDTPYDLTIDTSHTPSSVTVALVGVPWFEVDSWIGEPFDVGGIGGPFSIRCGRTVTHPDGTSSDDAYFWRYNEGYPG